jgi:CHAD domain-containing protein
MRLAFKQYRYSVEVLAPLFPSVTPDTMERLHAFQAMLGDIHDLDVILAEAAHFRRRVLGAGNESCLEPRVREIRRREYARLAPLIASPEALAWKVYGPEIRPAGRFASRSPEK